METVVAVGVAVVLATLSLVVTTVACVEDWTLGELGLYSEGVVIATVVPGTGADVVMAARPLVVLIVAVGRENIQSFMRSSVFISLLFACLSALLYFLIFGGLASDLYFVKVSGNSQNCTKSNRYPESSKYYECLKSHYVI